MRHEDAAVALGAGILLDVAGAAGGEDADGAVAGGPVGLLVGRGQEALDVREMARAASRRRHGAVGGPVVVVVADEALVHHRIRARAHRNGRAVSHRGVAALAQEAGFDEVLVIDPDAVLGDRLERVASVWQRRHDWLST